MATLTARALMAAGSLLRSKAPNRTRSYSTSPGSFRSQYARSSYIRSDGVTPQHDEDGEGHVLVRLALDLELLAGGADATVSVVGEAQAGQNLA